MNTRAVAKHVARRAYNRVGSDFGFANVERVLLYGAIIAGVVLIGKALSIGKRAKDAFTDTTDAIGSAIGGGLYSLFHPGEAERITSTDYTTIFPDKLFHAVNSLSVDGAGKFTLPKFYGAQKFQMLKLKAPVKYTAKNGVSHDTIYVAVAA